MSAGVNGSTPGVEPWRAPEGQRKYGRVAGRYSNPAGLLYRLDIAFEAPWAPEQCDGIDNDCDGEVDEGDGDLDCEQPYLLQP